MPAPILRSSHTDFDQQHQQNRPGMPLRQASDSVVFNRPPLRVGSSSSGSSASGVAASPSDILPGAAPIAAGHSIWTAPLEELPPRNPHSHSRPASSAGSYSSPHHTLRFLNNNSSSSTHSLPGLLAQSSSPTVQSPPATSESVSTPYEYKHVDSVENLGSYQPNKIRTSAFLRKRKPAPAFLDLSKTPADGSASFSVPIPVYASDPYSSSPSASQENLSKPGSSNPSASSSQTALPSALIAQQADTTTITNIQASSDNKKPTFDSPTASQSTNAAESSTQQQAPKRPALEPSLPTSMSVLDPWLQNRVAASDSNSPARSKASNGSGSPSSTGPATPVHAKPQGTQHARSQSSAMTARITGPGPLLRRQQHNSRPNSVVISNTSGSQQPAGAGPSSDQGVAASTASPLPSDVASNPLLGVLRAPPPPPKLDTNPLLLAVGDESLVPANAADDEDQEHLSESSPKKLRNIVRSPRYAQPGRPAVRSVSASTPAADNNAADAATSVPEGSSALGSTSVSGPAEPPAAPDSKTPSTVPPSVEHEKADGDGERSAASGSVPVDASVECGSTTILSPLTAALMSAPEMDGAVGASEPAERAHPDGAILSPLTAALLSPPELVRSALGDSSTPTDLRSGQSSLPSQVLPLAPISAQAVTAPMTPPNDSTPSRALDEPMKIPQGTHVGNPLLIGLANLPVQPTSPPTLALPKGPSSSSTTAAPTKRPDLRGPQWRSSSAAAQLLSLPFHRPKVHSPAVSTHTPWEDDDELRSAVEAASAFVTTNRTHTPSPRGEGAVVVPPFPARSTSHRTAETSLSAPPPSYSAASSAGSSEDHKTEKQEKEEEGAMGPTGYFASVVGGGVNGLTAPAAEVEGPRNPLPTPPIISLGTGPGGGGRPLPRIPTL
ncbi:hypothetical protein OC861_002938 [Tilletia horrida]|nr:hypothetical protein OC861_002938 [Tilletia horrida]